MTDRAKIRVKRWARRYALDSVKEPCPTRARRAYLGGAEARAAANQSNGTHLHRSRIPFFWLRKHPREDGVTLEFTGAASWSTPWAKGKACRYFGDRASPLPSPCFVERRTLASDGTNTLHNQTRRSRGLSGSSEKASREAAPGTGLSRVVNYEAGLATGQVSKSSRGRAERWGLRAEGSEHDEHRC